MIKTEKIFDIEYKLVQAFYWIGYCASYSFSAVVLQYRGFNNTQLGLILAFGNLCGFLISPLLASLIDRSEKVSVFSCLKLLLSAQLVLALALIFVSGSGLMASMLYCLFLAAVVATNPINTQLCFELEMWGHHTSYGAARGAGSLAYAPVSILLGILIQKFKPNILPFFTILFVLMQYAVMKRIESQAPADGEILLAGGTKRVKKGKTLPEFFRANPVFCLFLLGTALVFFAQNLITNFSINVVKNVGGNSSTLGIWNGYSAALEFFVMMFYDRLTQRIKCSTTIRIACLAFVMKFTTVALAANIPQLFAAQTLQAFSYALITPALVQYVSLEVSPDDSAKGQALSISMTTLATIFANIFGGMMYDAFTVRTTILIGSAVSAVGFIICLISTGTHTNHPQKTLILSGKK